MKKHTSLYTRTEKTLMCYAVFVMVVTLVAQSEKALHTPRVLVSPLATGPVVAQVTPTPTPSQKDIIAGKIKKVFGKYSDEAFRLLSCENASYDPKRINAVGNTPKQALDVGVFQIDDYWNGIHNTRLLQDADVNIQIAWYKFKSSGYSFNQWSCAKKVGLK